MAPRWRSPVTLVAGCGCGTCGPGRRAANRSRCAVHGVEAVAVGELDGTPVAVTGGDDGAVRVWDLRAAAPASEALSHTGLVRRWRSGSWTAPRWQSSAARRVRCGCGTCGPGRPAGNHLAATPRIVSVAIGELDGTPVAVSSDNGSDVRGGRVLVWDLRTGAARGELRPRQGFLKDLIETYISVASVFVMAVGEADGTPVAVSSNSEGRVRVWDLRTGAVTREPLAGRISRVVDGTLVAVGRVDGRMRVWDLQTGEVTAEAVGEIDGGLVAVGEVDGTPVAVSCARDGTVQVWDLRTGAARGEPFAGHTSRVTAVAVGEVDGTPVAVSGDRDGTILLWALDRGQCISARLDAPSGVTAIVAGGRAGWLTATEDGSLFLWVPAIGTMTRATEDTASTTS